MKALPTISKVIYCACLLSFTGSALAEPASEENENPPTMLQDEVGVGAENRDFYTVCYFKVQGSQPQKENWVWGLKSNAEDWYILSGTKITTPFSKISKVKTTVVHGSAEDACKNARVRYNARLINKSRKLGKLIATFASEGRIRPNLPILFNGKDYYPEY